MDTYQIVQKRANTIEERGYNRAVIGLVDGSSAEAVLGFALSMGLEALPGHVLIAEPIIKAEISFKLHKGIAYLAKELS